MSEENENKEASKEASQGNNKRYIALALVVILAAVGIMMNNNAEQKATEPTTVASAEHPKVSDEPTIARIDITTPLVNADVPQFEVYVDGSEEPLKQADWMPKYNIQGVTFQKKANNARLILKPLLDTKIDIALRGIWEKDATDNLIPHYVTYKNFQINNENILMEPQTVWVAEPFIYSINAKAGEKIDLDFSWQ